ncbi:amino acid adenylation domain-containing protein [Actinosynnema sp. CS-041913]|uniref:non-ribosomal peptide synthetase n=1 Tax=Actinosynnema sp. CS-041913 TaxID=3239917 RepID=UPI003D8BEDEE
MIRQGPASFAQQRLLVLDRLAAGLSAYHMPVVLRLRGDLDVQALTWAVNELVARHEVLRTSFADDGDPVQVVEAVTLPEIVVRPASDDLDSEIRDEIGKPFDLSRAPLVRAKVFARADDDHTLVLVIHHIACDGWSLGVLVDDLSTLYSSYLSGRPARLPKLPVQYADFARDQREWMSGDVLDGQLAYWRTQLADLPDVLSLPADRPRPAVSTFAGARRRVTIPEDVAVRVDELCRAHHVTPFMVLLAGFSAVLGRWCSTTDVAVGSPIANRTREDTARMIGFFVNMLVLRTDLTGEPTFRELVDRVRDTALSAYAHQDVPFERLVEDLAPARNLAHPPLFQVSFALQNVAIPDFRMAGLTVTPVEVDWGTSKFDLWVSVTRVEEGYAVTAEYNTDIFDGDTIDRVLRWYLNFLDAVTLDPDRRVSRVDLLDAAERHQVTAGWNATDRPVPEDCVPHLVAERAAAHPDVIAVVSGDERLTYGELHAEAERVAGSLAALGVGVDDVVGICFDRGLAMITAILGVQYAGAAYLPLDPELPRDRLAFQTADAAARIVLTDDEHRDLAPGDCHLIADLPAGPAIPCRARPGTAAYVIYTSGSTGRPKGVVTEHRALANRLRWMQDTYRLTSTDRVLQKTPYGFDVSVWELLWPLTAGATLVFARPGGHRDPEYLSGLIRRHGVTVTHFVPPALSAFLAVADPAGCVSLRLVVCSGEALPVEVVRRFTALVDARLDNLYGPTEAAIDVTWYPCAELPAAAMAVPIGRPIDNIRIHLLDALGQPVGPGVVGELHIGGIGLARGYAGRPGLTAERFVPDPFGAPGGRLYRTGDLARWRPDGTVEFLGRADFQVKVRGFRIELGEIETVLAEHPLVRQAVVLTRRSEAGDARLSGFVVLDEPAAEDDGRARLDQWSSVFDRTYAGPDPASARFDTAGWNSSFGGAIPDEEMKVWTDTTVERIRELRPRRVLEIGCGTGLLMWPLLSEVDEYCGTDVSAVVVDRLAERLAAQGGSDKVGLWHRAAHELDDLPAGRFDVVVLNSVVQYFPNVEYLRAVLAGVRRLLAPGGSVFLGDLRHLGLLDTLRAEVELAKVSPDADVETVRDRIDRSVDAEEELLLHPSIVDELAEVLGAHRCEVALKRGRYRNEVNAYRYDVTFRLGEPPTPFSPTVLPWEGPDGWHVVRKHCADEPGLALLVTGLPNSRLRTAHQRATLLRSAAPGAAVAELPAVEPVELPDPADLWELADATGFHATVAPGGSDPHTVDLLLTPAADHPGTSPHHVITAHSPHRAGAVANDPSALDRRRRHVEVLHDHLADRLPQYMIPNTLDIVEALPMTANGKVDRNALAARRSSGVAAPSVAAVQFGGRLAYLAEVWAQLLHLGRDAVGIEDNFFDLGGDSIKAILVSARLRGDGLALSPADIIEAQTLTAMERRIRDLAADSGTPDGQSYVDRVRNVPAAVVQDAYPLSALQGHMLTRYLRDPAPGLYRVQRVATLVGDLDFARMRQAWEDTIRSHPLLRTSFDWTAQGGPLQIVRSDLGLNYREEDWRAVDPADLDAALDRLLVELREPVLDLRDAGPVDLTLVRLPDNRCHLVLGAHYLCTDGWSFTIVTNDALRRYAGASTDDGSGAAGFRDFVTWAVARDTTEAQRFWTGRLAGAPSPKLAGPGLGGPVRSLRFTLDAETTSRLFRRARALHGTPNSLVQSCWAAALAGHLDTDDVVYGLLVSGRSAPLAGIESTVGVLMNVLPARVRVDAAEPVESLVPRVGELALEIQRHEFVPLDRIAEWTGRAEPLFDSYFVFQNIGSFASTLPDLELPGIEIPPQSNLYYAHMEHPLRIDVFPARSLEVVASFDTTAIPDADVTGLLDRFQALLTRVAG